MSWSKLAQWNTWGGTTATSVYRWKTAETFPLFDWWPAQFHDDSHMCPYFNRRQPLRHWRKQFQSTWMHLGSLWRVIHALCSKCRTTTDLWVSMSSTISKPLASSAQNQMAHAVHMGFFWPSVKLTSCETIQVSCGLVPRHYNFHPCFCFCFWLNSEAEQTVSMSRNVESAFSSPDWACGPCLCHWLWGVQASRATAERKRWPDNSNTENRHL